MPVRCPTCGAELPAGFAFCGHCGARLDAPARADPDSSPVRPLQESPDLSGQRREVTVLFADVAGFTSISERLDPEEVHFLMNRCFDGLGRAVADAEGHIDKYIGDAMMALFGAPIAHEDDPARAC